MTRFSSLALCLASAVCYGLPSTQDTPVQCGTGNVVAKVDIRSHAMNEAKMVWCISNTTTEGDKCSTCLDDFPVQPATKTIAIGADVDYFVFAFKGPKGGEQEFYPDFVSGDWPQSYDLQDPNTTIAATGEPPCCQGKCTEPGEEKYWSIAKSILGTKHCGECCMKPSQYPLYHRFEKNLTKSDSDEPCKGFGYTKYDSTVTHGFGPIKMTLDLYDLPPSPSPPSPPDTPVCKSTEYCCPDAKACLTPTEKSCKDDANACASGEVCCPLTKLCVIPGKPCTSPCAQDSYCCPDAKKCLTPTNPGVKCSYSSPCKANEICCPLTKICVTADVECKPAAEPSFRDIMMNRWARL